jgi:glycosyltransferase involved in cell wall biosynthesis
MTIWFDVEDLVHYFRSGNKRISGIQRLSFEIFRGLHALGTEDVRFVRHGARPPSLLPVAWGDLVAEFGDDGGAEAPAPTAPASVAEVAEPVRSWPRLLGRRAVDVLPPHVRKPLVLASVMQAQVAWALAVFGGNLAALPVRRAVGVSRWMAGELAWRGGGAKKRPVGAGFETMAQPGDTLLVLGAPWNRERYSDIARFVRDERRMRFGVLVHDLVPIRHPEWCHRGQPRAFREWYSDVLPFCDVVFANSAHTAQDVEAFARESGMVLNRPVRTLPIGTGFGTGFGTGTAPAAVSGDYVLFVSTLEARKNHALTVRIWSKLLDEVAAGTREAASVPDLVFAGRVGWLVSDLLGQLEATQWLGGRVRLVKDPTDAELRALYAGCLFTLFPSLHEGWGLPVTESLALGKPCLASNAASLPEAGGALCRYFDPESLGSAYAAVCGVLDDREGLARWQAQVCEAFRPVPWTETGRVLVETLAGLEQPGAAAFR